MDRDGDLDLLVTDWNPGAVIAADVARGEASDRTSGQCNRSATTRRDLAARPGRARPATRACSATTTGPVHRRHLGPRAWPTSASSLAFTPQTASTSTATAGPTSLVTGDACTSAACSATGDGDRFDDVTRRAAGVGTDENGMGSVDPRPRRRRPSRLARHLDRLPDPGRRLPRPPRQLRGLHRQPALPQPRSPAVRPTPPTSWACATAGWGWGAAAADFGNDGRLQAAVTNGRLGGETVDPSDQTEVYYAAFTGDPTRFFVRGPDDVFTDAAEDVGIRDEEVSHALVVFDHDRDGRLDLLVANAGAAPYLYRNVTTAPRRHWIGVRLRDPSTPGNAHGLGARVEISSSTGAVTTQWVHTSGSYESQHPAETHVGMGSATAARVRGLVAGRGAAAGRQRPGYRPTRHRHPASLTRYCRRTIRRGNSRGTHRPSHPVARHPGPLRVPARDRATARASRRSCPAGTTPSGAASVIAAYVSSLNDCHFCMSFPLGVRRPPASRRAGRWSTGSSTTRRRPRSATA